MLKNIRQYQNLEEDCGNTRDSLSSDGEACRSNNSSSVSEAGDQIVNNSLDDSLSAAGSNSSMNSPPSTETDEAINNIPNFDQV